MKFTRRANATWKGSGKKGKGTLTTPSGALDQTPYTFSDRFENGKGANPEEIVGAVLAGCFNMQFAVMLSDEGYTADQLKTEAKVTFEDGRITEIHLDLTGEVEGIEVNKFREIAQEAKKTCPIARSLSAKIILEAELVASKVY